MRLLVAVVGALAVSLVGSIAFARCGLAPGDGAAVTTAEAAVTDLCHCCGARTPYAACVRSAVKGAVQRGTLPRHCATTVRRESVRACPLRPTAVPCRACNVDGDCAASEFCACVAGTCSPNGGVCTLRPQVCPDIVAPVCGCDGTTYANDCLRLQAGACRLHAGSCAPPPTTTTLPGGGCQSDGDCDDGNACTVDRCVAGACEHGCVCIDPAGGTTCCPGPAALCARPCGADIAGTCGGTCPERATCQSLATAAPSCGCVSGVGGPCGGNILAPPPVCAPGLVCQQPNPDVTGVCVTPGCVSFFELGCVQTSDCCVPCSVVGRAPCAVCIQGVCVGAP